MRVKQLFMAVLAMLIFGANGMTQEASFLVKAQPLDNELNNWIRSQPAPVYLKQSDYVLLELDQYALHRLRKMGYSVKVLDQNPALHFYVFIPSSASVVDLSRYGSAILHDPRGALLKATPAQVDAILATGTKVRKARRVVPTPAFSFQPDQLNRHDPFIQALVDQVALDSIRTTIKDLENFRTRYSYAPQCSLAADYLKGRFIGYGLQVVDDWYETGVNRQRNIVAIQPGKRSPEKIYLIGGHYDSIAWPDPMTNAPGADDNASGVAAALECARILSQYNFDCTFKYVAFCGEEQWMVGSYHYAENAAATGEQILAMINNDMIAYTSDGDQEDLEVIADYASEWLADVWVSAAKTYAALKVTKQVDPTDPSDHLPFWENGFIAIDCAEDDVNEIWGGTNPNYHTPGDTLGTLSLEFATEAVKMNLAGLAMLQVLLPPVQGLQVVDPGTGTELILGWDAYTLPNAKGFRVHYGTASLEYDHVLDAGAETRAVVRQLQEGKNYFFAVCAYDSSGRDGILSLEVMATPLSVPRAPLSLKAVPARLALHLHWQSNAELDLLGYHVYRRTGEAWTRITETPWLRTAYVDSPLTEARRYWYAVTAIDSGLNESPFSDSVSSVPGILDHGILLVDETRDGNGTLLNPTDAQVDDFYHQLLSGYRITDWDVKSQGLPDPEQIMAFSTVIWHGDDATDRQFGRTKELFRDYLSVGGKLWLSGWKILAAGRFNPETVENAWFHITEIKEQPQADFLGASGQLGYPDVAIDPGKMTANWRDKMPGCVKFSARDAEVIFSFNSASANPDFHQQPCGLRYLGADYRLVLLGFPLYYLQAGSAAALAQKILNDFGEISPVQEEFAAAAAPEHYGLAQNYPNPFATAGSSQTTAIRYQLPEKTRVQITIYNIMGQRVCALVDREQLAGANQVRWNGQDDQGTPVAAGIYFYELKTKTYQEMRKLVLMR